MFTFHDFQERVLESPVKFICGGVAVVLALVAAITLMPPLGIAAAVFGIISFASEFGPISHVNANDEGIALNDDGIDYDFHFIFDISNISTQTNVENQNGNTDSYDLLGEISIFSI